MLRILATTWPLFLGMALLMVGNGMQGTLLGLRGEIEGFSTASMSFVMSAYFLGFLGGSQLTPVMIARVGHVRVFAALASLISAALILYPVAANPWAWVVLRVVVGFCFSGVYVTAESWLNNATTSENRGITLSAYMVTQSVGVLTAQGLLTLADPSGFVLFVIPSVLVSLSFAPILLAASPTPAFETAKPMSFRKLFHRSPLGVVGMLLMGGVFASQFGMSAVYATQAGFGTGAVAAFVGAIYAGGFAFQLPFGWLSDRIDRRKLILLAAAIGSAVCAVPLVLPLTLPVLLFAGFVMGGMANPLYALLLAHTNDHLDYDDMSAASGRMVFLNGLGAVAGPLATGALISAFGPTGYWMLLVALMGALSGYAGWRMTRRAAVALGDAAAYVAVSPGATRIAVETAQEWASDQTGAEPERDAKVSEAA